jgi:hypothetical protein
MSIDPLAYLEQQLTLRERARMAHQDRELERQSNLSAMKERRIQEASDLLGDLLGIDLPSWDPDHEDYKWDIPTNPANVDDLKFHFRAHGLTWRVLMTGVKDERHPTLQVNQSPTVLTSPSGWSAVTSLADLGALMTKHVALAREPEDG